MWTYLETVFVFFISLGRPEIFEKVAKIGRGCTFGSYKSPNSLTIKSLIANNSGYDLLSLGTVFLIYLKNDHCAYEKTCSQTYKKKKKKKKKILIPIFSSFFLFFTLLFPSARIFCIQPFRTGSNSIDLTALQK